MEKVLLGGRDLYQFRPVLTISCLWAARFVPKSTEHSLTPQNARKCAPPLIQWQVAAHHQLCQTGHSPIGQRPSAAVPSARQPPCFRHFPLQMLASITKMLPFFGIRRHFTAPRLARSPNEPQETPDMSDFHTAPV